MHPTHLYVTSVLGELQDYSELSKTKLYIKEPRFYCCIITEHDGTVRSQGRRKCPQKPMNRPVELRVRPP